MLRHGIFALIQRNMLLFGKICAKTDNGLKSVKYPEYRIVSKGELISELYESWTVSLKIRQLA